MVMDDIFRKIAQKTSEILGSPKAFVISCGLVVIWALFGPAFNYSDTWQLVINTSTTILTFLMIFLVQNTQNRDAKAIHLKLDELIRATKRAHNHMVNLEELSDKELNEIHDQFHDLGTRAKKIKESREAKATEVE